MKILAKVISQTKKPTGFLGAVLTKAMNRAHSQLTNWGLSFLEIEEDHNILDIGCGGGKTVNKLAKTITNGKVYGIDHSDVSVRSSTKLNRYFIDQNRVEIRRASVSSIPYPDNSFDIIIAIESYFFWPNLESDMREVLRVLRSEGRLLLVSEIVRTAENEKTIDRYARLAATSDYMDYKTKEELNQLFINTGYDNVMIHVNMKHGWICGLGCKP
ncbi:MAG: class I SAM-dependent methyltransferase [Desulfomonilaceae bacterium]